MSTADPSHFSEEVKRLRQLCLRLLNEHNDGAGGSRLTQVQSNEIKASLTAAWEELERKQGYLEAAVAENARLKDSVGASVSSPEVEKLQASLHEAWAELERKQVFLENYAAQNTALQAELNILRAKSS